GSRPSRRPRPFNYSALNNRGAAYATGEILLFLNDDTEPQTPDWLERMIGYAQQPHVGAVGARLHFPDGSIQHCGVVN
ncbi:glycosyltransferase family 2 protein, partial [Escherichia coli]|uniref:glycosyltransferase family 2 protein n=1 Tax=Escherichia coli TaxID=562 RepID=UPI001124383F